MDISITKSNQYYRRETTTGTAYYHFSFAEYYNPANMNFGSLRAFNEYKIQNVEPELGHGWQSYRDIEIVTFLIEGEFEYKNNKGNREAIHAGDVSLISAGVGIVSSSRIRPGTKSINLLEIWAYPKKYSLKPSFKKSSYTKEIYKDKLLPVVVSENSVDNHSVLIINQDVNIYISRLSPHNELDYKLKLQRGAYLFVMSGGISINGNFHI